MKVIIPQGYIIEITTWENDGDNYKTEKLNGLSKEKCLFYKNIAEAFYRTNSSKHGFGNKECGSGIREKFIELFGEKYKELYCQDEVKEDIEENLGYWISDCFYDVIGTWNDDDYWRVVDNYKIYFVPKAIEYELCDVDSELNPTTNNV